MANQINFHGFVYKPLKNDEKILNERFLIQPKPVLVEGTGDTKIDITDKLDLVELAESYKDQCGVEYMLKQIKLGMAVPAQFADDGQHSGDASAFPDNAADAYQAALKANEQKKELAKQLGIPVENLTEENIAAKVAEIFGKVDGKTQEVKKDE